MKNEFNDFFNRVGLMLAIDYGSRGGNAFFLTLFDNHPEVATMPWLMYCYSYIYTEYGKKENLDSKHAHRLVTSTGYFRYIYNEPNEITIKEIEKWGGSPYAIKNRDQIRQCFDELVLEEEKISRKKLICAMFYSYVQSLGVDINKFKYILMSDAISLRTESPQRGFSGKITELAHKDFENFRLINLHRDLRAQFASCRHQFINQNLNMYGLRIGNAGIRLSELLRMNFKIENFCFHYWAQYQIESFFTMQKISKKFHKVTNVINEEVNLNFVPTMKRLASEFEVSFLDEWSLENYIPSSMREKWKGTGAYNTNYQKIVDGPLKNDKNEDVKNSIGPNSITPNRWKDRLPFNEKILLTVLFRKQLKQFYPVSILVNSRLLSLWIIFLIIPFSGELLSFKNRKGKSLLEYLNYIFFLPVFYIVSRVSMFRLVQNYGQGSEN